MVQSTHKPSTQERWDKHLNLETSMFYVVSSKSVRAIIRRSCL